VWAACSFGVLKQVVHIVTTGLYTVKSRPQTLSDMQLLIKLQMITDMREQPHVTNHKSNPEVPDKNMTGKMDTWEFFCTDCV
jgi:hypothetical protein